MGRVRIHYPQTGEAVLAQKTPITLGSLAVGETVTLNVDGAPWEWIVVHQGKPSSIYSDTFNGGTILMMKDIYENRQWHSADVNDYAKSTIHAYLNSTFLAKLDPAVQAAVKQVKIPYRAGSGYGTTVTSGENGLAAKVWLASGYEVGFTVSDSQYSPADGAKFSYFLSGGAADAKSKRLGYLNGSATRWWLRSPYCLSNHGSTRACDINSDGSYDYGLCSNSYGTRPCLVLPDSFVTAEPATLTDFQGNPLSIPAEQISGIPKIVVGSYTGDGAAERIIDLGFYPVAVLVFRERLSSMNSAVVGTDFGLATRSVPQMDARNGSKILKLVDNGFKVYEQYEAATNVNDNKFKYIAIG